MLARARRGRGDAREGRATLARSGPTGVVGEDTPAVREEGLGEGEDEVVGLGTA